MFQSNQPHTSVKRHEMMSRIFIFVILLFSHNTVAQDWEDRTVPHRNDTSSLISRQWLHSYEKEIAFFDKINSLRYEGYPYIGDDYYSSPMGYLMCYTSNSFLEKAGKEFQKLGLPSVVLCKSLDDDKDSYCKYIKSLRSFIDTDAYLHSDDGYPYAMTNARGIALFDIELYVTEFIFYILSSHISINDKEQLLKYHNTILNCFRFWFTISYHSRGMMQMSGLTGDTYRACWPYLRLYNEILHKAVISEDYEGLFRIYKNIIPFISYYQTISSRNYNEELLRALSDDSVDHTQIINTLSGVMCFEDYELLFNEFKNK